MSTPLRKKLQRQEQHQIQKEKRQRKMLLLSIKKKETFTIYEPKSTIYRRETKNYPSVQSTGAIGEFAAKPKRTAYSGDYLVGIATMHKSNAVPVGRGDNPENYSTMRRN